MSIIRRFSVKNDEVLNFKWKKKDSQLKGLFNHADEVYKEMVAGLIPKKKKK